MRDYEELVRRLREADSLSMCGECGYKGDKKGPLFADAADAIEELMGRTKVLEKVADKWCEAAPKWISVEERLPTPREKVVVAYSKGVTIAQMDGYIKDPKTRVHYWRGLKGPKHSLASVTHWMPLPEPPKEDDNG